MIKEKFMNTWLANRKKRGSQKSKGEHITSRTLQVAHEEYEEEATNHVDAMQQIDSNVDALQELDMNWQDSLLQQ